MKKLAWMGMLVLALGGCADMGGGVGGYSGSYWDNGMGGPFSEFGYDGADMGFGSPFDPFGFGPFGDMDMDMD